MKKQASLVSAVVLFLAAIFSFSFTSTAQTSPYCETEVQHLGIAAEVASKIKLTIANVDATSMIVEIESADADPVDFLLVNGGSGATISAEDFSVPGKISRTLTWAAPPASVVLNVLWSKASFGGNWQLSPADVTLAFADTCSSNPVPPDTTSSTSTSPYCETEVQHLGIAAEVPSRIKLTVDNVDANSMIIEIESADADPVDFLLVNGGSGATISPEDFSVPGKISRTLTWVTPPDTVSLNVLWSKASFPGNWQLSPGDVLLAFADTCAATSSPPAGPSSTTVNFAVNMTGFAGSFGTVYVAGDFNGWCGGCNPLSDTDGDGIWTGSDTIVQDSMEFKYQLDQWAQQENLTPGSPCTKSTGGFTNRFALLPAGTVNLPAYCYSTCDLVCVPPAVVKVAVDMNSYPVAFGTVYVAGEFNGWCGGCDPLSDVDGDGIWTGMISTTLDSFEYKFQLDQWAQQETLDPVGDAACTKSTGGFTNRFVDLGGADTLCLDTVCYEECTACTAAPPTPKFVKVSVDMSQFGGSYGTVYIAGEFNTWCGGCNPLSDPDGDSIWTGSISTALDSFEYKFQLDMWAQQENLDPVGDAACTKSAFGFTNRFVDLSAAGDTVCLDTVCYEACDACQPLLPPVDITFIVDMSLAGPVDTTGVYIVGPFNGFDPTADQLTPIGSNQYSKTISGFTPGESVTYKFLNGNSFSNAENVNSGPCAANNGFGDRIFTVPAANATLGPDCFGSCGPCQPPVDITFIVDMSQEDTVNGTVYIVGPFNNFDPAANPMTPIGNGQYSTTISGIQSGSQINFKYLNGPSFGNGESVNSGACAANNGFGDRTLLVPATDATVGPDCFGLCGPCPVLICDSGQTAYEIVIGASASDFPNEMSWQLINTTTGDTIFDVPCGSYGPTSVDTVCLNNGDTYVFNANDDWGDGWNNGFYIITDLNNDSLLAAGFPDNTVPGDFTDDCVGADIEESITFIGGGAAIIPGCTDPSAINYNPLANVDDSTCLFAAANDICDSAIAVSVIGFADTCDYVIQSTNNATADSSSLSICDNVGVNLDLWYTFVAPPSGNVFFDIILGTTPLVEAAVYEACGDSVIACFNTQTGTAFSGFTPGQQYILQLWTDDFNSGLYGLCLKEFVSGCTDPLAQNYNPSANVDDGSCVYPLPANDLCSNATLVSCGDTSSGLTSGATVDTTLSPCVTSLNTAPGVWYRFNGTNDSVVVSTCGSTFDTKLGVYAGSCGNLACVTGNDDACGAPGLPPRQSQVKFLSEIGVTYYIYVTGFGADAGQYQLSIDCLPAPCPAPTNLSSTQQTASTALLNWDPVAPADNYVIRGNKAGTPGFVYLQAANPPKLVGGLDMNSSYVWQVQAVCSGNQSNPVSAFSPLNTFTMMPCAKPAGVSTINVTENSATLTWTAVPGAAGYKIRGREVGTNSYANITTTSNLFTVNGLDSETTYEWTVRVVCGNGVTSDASPLQTFTTAGLDSKTGEWTVPESSLSIYPNPAKDQFTLSFNSIGTFDNVDIQLYDLQGKLVHQFNRIDVMGSININLPDELRNGMYQVIVNHDGQVFQDKLIIVR